MAIECQVAIAGAGPVGMTLALDLARRGIAVAVIEKRADGDPADAKCNSVAARTMETFRRLGIADIVRAAGLPDDYPTDVVFSTTLCGKEITRIEFPSRNERYDSTGEVAMQYPDSHWRTPEPVLRLSQIYLDPILREQVKEDDGILFLSSTVVVDYDDHGEGVVVYCQPIDRNEPFEIHARYLVGCDGGASTIRKIMGVEFKGDEQISRTRSSLIRSKDVLPLFRGKPAWMTWVVNHRQTGTIVAIDGDELWLVHRGVSDEMESFDSVDPDQSIRDVLGVGDEFTYEIVQNQDWIGRRLVAERFKSGNVFICGDAAHIWVPLAGYGMNAGIADAMNLSWLLSAVLTGWAPEGLLDVHEIERHPITEQVSRFAMSFAFELRERPGPRIPKMLEQPGPVGYALRKLLGHKLHDLNVQQFACEGLNFGYYYEHSPIVCYDDERAPSYTMGSATASTVPGCRMPHFWIDEVTSLYDRLGDWFTIVRFDPSVDVQPLLAAARHQRVPLEVLDVPNQKEKELFRHKLVMVRPDYHVAWRSDSLPCDSMALVRKISGGEL